MSRSMIGVLIMVGSMCLGCGSENKIMLPTEPLTDAQKAQIKKDDAKIADEESQGAKRR